MISSSWCRNALSNRTQLESLGPQHVEYLAARCPAVGDEMIDDLEGDAQSALRFGSHLVEQTEHALRNDYLQRQREGVQRT